MSFPKFYDPARVGELFTPETGKIVDEGHSAGIQPSATDEQKIILLLVDEQVDFVHENGSLSVPGAVADTRRLIEWLLNNIGQVTTIAASLDSHVPIQIFFPTWWQDSTGNHPDPMTPISSEDVRKGRWKPIYEPEWSIEYVERLEEQAKKLLMIWPYHVLIGTPGHNITPALYQAIAYHTAARRSQPLFLSKGTIAKTEHYSILEPEVKVPEEPQGDLNTKFLNEIMSYDLVYVAGQAKSHCVLETVTSIMRHFENQPQIIGKLRLLTDCMSSVAHPEIDFDGMANGVLERYAANGLTMVKSTDPVG